MATLAELQTRLSEVEAAIHSLAIGEKVVEVMRAGRRMKFTEASLDALRGYRDDLTQQIAAATAEANGRPRRQAIGTYL